MIYINKIYPKSQRYIRNSFLELLKTKTYQDITITEIVNNGGVARTTFYAYYNDKGSLLEEIEKDLFDTFINILMDAQKIGIVEFHNALDKDEYPYLAVYFQHFRDNYKAYKILFNDANGLNFSRKFEQKWFDFSYGTKFFWNKDHRGYREGDLEQMLSENLHKLTISIYVEVFKIWINSDMKIEEEALGYILMKTMQGLLGTSTAEKLIHNKKTAVRAAHNNSAREDFGK